MTSLHNALEVFLGQEAFTDDRERQLRALADAIPLIVWTANPNGELDYYNRQWEIYTGFTTEETKGWGWAPVLQPDDLQACIERWTQAFTSGEPYEIEYRFKRASDGAYRWHLGRAVPFRDASGAIMKWFGTGTDIDDQVRGKEQLNQAYIEVEEEARERTIEPASTKQMLLRQNEVRKAAVEALQQDSARLNEIITTQEYARRLGGDEFAIILEELTNPSDAEKVASKIIESVRPEIQVDDMHLKVTTTIGIAYYQAQWDVEQLLDMADKAMYRAKQEGRNRIGI